PVPWLTPTRRCVLDQQVFPRRAVHSALDHLDVATHTVLLVHDIVARAQLQRVDGVAAPNRHAPLTLGGRTRLTEQVGLGQQGQPVTFTDEATFQAGARDVY